jgi:hypothetical protein
MQPYTPNLDVVTTALEEIPHHGTVLRALRASGAQGVRRLDIDPTDLRYRRSTRFEVVAKNIREILFGLLGTIGRQARIDRGHEATTIASQGSGQSRFIPSVEQRLADRLGMPTQVDPTKSETLRLLAEDFSTWVASESKHDGRVEDGGLRFRYQEGNVEVVSPERMILRPERMTEVSGKNFGDRPAPPPRAKRVSESSKSIPKAAKPPEKKAAASPSTASTVENPPQRW